MDDSSIQSLRKRLDSALYYLYSAQEHASLAHRAQNAPSEEKPFLQFLQMLLDRLLAGKIMLKANTQWTIETSSVRRFLAAQASADDILPSAANISISEIFRDMLGFTRAGAAPFENLRALCIKKLSEEGRVRYEKAASSLRKHLAETKNQPRPMIFAQTAYPILGTKAG